MKKILVTCEHSGNEIPGSFRYLFTGQNDLLNSHKGYDIGACDLYEALVQEIADMHMEYDLSRLLIDPNRSLHNKAVFSELSRSLDSDSKDYIIATFYQPYRKGVESLISNAVISDHYIIHIAVHTFTPVMHGKERDADIGLLYDPSRGPEKNLCKLLRHHITKNDPTLRVRFNYPYKGTSDGLVPYLRTQFDQNIYTGIELEVNQRFATADEETCSQIENVLLCAFRSAILDNI